MAQYIYSMRKVRKAVGDKVILDDVTMSFYPGAKIGMVGRIPSQEEQVGSPSADFWEAMVSVACRASSKVDTATTWRSSGS